jgi:hypothetical protein
VTRSFAEEWSRIRLIPAGQEIPHWSVEGRVHGSFNISGVDSDAVIVKSGKINGERRIPKADFQTVFVVWEAYCDGDIPRSHINDLTLNSTYILGILNWIKGPR